MVRLGIERLVRTEIDVLRGDRVGLITNPSGVDSALTPTIDILHEREDLDLTRLFAPEHGIRGDKQAGVHVDDVVDDETGLPVRSLYGTDRRLDPDAIDDLDAVVYDVQDTGCRFYTLIYTLAYALEGCSAADVRLVVLDRPNPIAPLGVRGNRLAPGRETFVGGRRLPVTHAMTVGELARYFDDAFDIGADLHVVELDGWSRDTWYDELNLAWVPPSPNMPTLETATVYPGTCLFEGTNVSEGRGTTKPFEYVGAPWFDGAEWAATLNDLDLDGVAFRPAYFSPTFSKHERRDVEGVQVHVVDRDRFDPVRTGITMVISAFQRYPETDWVRADGSWFVDDLAGGSWLREAIVGVDPDESAAAVYDRLRDDWGDDRDAFERRAADYRIYGP